MTIISHPHSSHYQYSGIQTFVHVSLFSIEEPSIELFIMQGLKRNELAVSS